MSSIGLFLRAGPERGLFLGFSFVGGGRCGLRRGGEGGLARAAGRGVQSGRTRASRRGFVEEQGWKQELLPPLFLLLGGCFYLFVFFYRKVSAVTFYEVRMSSRFVRSSLKGGRCDVCRGRHLCIVLCCLLSLGGEGFYGGRRTGR